MYVWQVRARHVCAPEDLSAGCRLLRIDALLRSRRDREVRVRGVGVERPRAAPAPEALRRPATPHVGCLKVCVMQVRR